MLGHAASRHRLHPAAVSLGNCRRLRCRWRSFHRRHTRGSDDFEARVEDLAKGLGSAFEPEPRLVGPLMTDYRHLAHTLAVVFAQASDTSKGD